MRHQNYLYLEYARALKTFKKLQTRFEKRISNNTFQELTARRRYKVLSKLRKLKQRIDQLTSRLKLAAVGGSMAFTMAMAVDGTEAHAQDFEAVGTTKEMSMYRVLANDVTTGDQFDPSIAYNNDGNFAVVWGEESQTDQILKAKAYGGSEDASLDLNITAGQFGESNASIAMNDENQIVVAWQEGTSYVKYMRYEIEGDEVNAEGPFTAAGNSESFLTDPAVAIDQNGNFSIVWSEMNTNSNFDIKGSYYTHDNASAGAFDISENTATNQLHPAIDMDDAGNFVVVWDETVGLYEGSQYNAVNARKYKQGVADGELLQVATMYKHTTSDVPTPDVALVGDGSFVVAWKDYTGSGDNGYVQTYNADGNSSDLIDLELPTSAVMSSPQIAVDKDGGFAVAIQFSIGLDKNIGLMRFNRLGSVIDFVPVLNDESSDNVSAPALAMNNRGDMMVAWSDDLGAIYGASCGDEGTDCDGSGVYFSQLKGQGNGPEELVGEQKVNSASSSDAYNPSVDTDLQGNYVVAWEAYGDQSIDSGYGIYAQRYQADGTKIGDEFHVNNISTSNDQFDPEVAVNANGDFMITWTNETFEGSKYGIYSRMYAADGTALGDEFRVDQNIITNSNLGEASVDYNSEGEAVVVWNVNNTNNLYGRKLNGSNSFDGAEFKINTSTNSDARFEPTVALSEEGSFVVAWGGTVTANSIYSTNMRRYDGEAAALDTDEVVVSTDMSPSPQQHAIAMDQSTGEFMVAYTEDKYLYASKYQIDGTAVFEGKEIYDDINDDYKIGVSANTQGEFAIVWQSGGYEMEIALLDQENEFVYQGFEAYEGNNLAGTDIALSEDGDAILAYSKQYGIYTKTISQPREGRIDAGTEFIVNSTPEGTHTAPSVAQNAEGDFVVAWSAGYGNVDIRAQRYTANGVRLGGEILVNNEKMTLDEEPLVFPKVALTDEGNFMIVWETGGGDTSIPTDPLVEETESVGKEIYGSVFDWDGNEIKDDFIVNTGRSTGDQYYPDVVVDDSGDFRVAWVNTVEKEVEEETEKFSSVSSIKFDASGVPDSEGIQALVEEEAGDSMWIDMAINNDGDIAVVYSIRDEETGKAKLSAYTRTLEPLAQGLLASENGVVPSVAAGADGQFMMAWVSDGDSYSLYARSYAGGEGFADEAHLIKEVDENTFFSIAAVEDGDFVVTYPEKYQGSPLNNFFVQRISGEAEKIGAAIQVNEIPGFVFPFHAVAASADGDYTVVWSSKYAVSGGEEPFDSSGDAIADEGEGPSGPQAAVMARQFVSHKPVVSLADFTVDEGAEKEITQKDLDIQNPSGGEAVVKINSLPASGTLKLDGNSVALDQELSEDDLYFLSYAHGGDESTEDSFTFSVANADFETSEKTFLIGVNGINDLPSFVGNLEDQTVDQFSAYSFTLPTGLFTDADDATLTLSVSLANGALPSWLSYDATTGILSGTPTEAGELAIELTATDQAGAKASGSFTLTVNAVLSAGGVENPVVYYPNPVASTLHLKPSTTMMGDIQVNLFNESGRMVKSTVFKKQSSNQVFEYDVQNLERGLYFLRMVNENTTTTFKISKL